MEMQELLSMGFSQDLATQALAATGGKSTLKATEWILNISHHNTPSTSTPPSSTRSPNPTSSSPVDQNPNFPPFQPKLDRFFQSKSKPSSSTSLIDVGDAEIAIDEEESPPQLKRRKVPIQSQSFPSRPQSVEPAPPPHEPLSERMRPRTIHQVVGQDHLLASKSILRSAIDCHRLPSVVLWGPPGTGKTSIAKALVNSIASSASQKFSYRFVCLSAVTSGVKDVREAVENARKFRMKGNKRTVLFVDEVHRFNKSQQDSFLPVIEDGSVVFMGATTENPSFHLITPLLSRCRVLVLNQLQPHHLAELLKRAAADTEKGLACSVGMKVQVSEDAMEFISSNCDGDARVALNVLEISATTALARLPDQHPPEIESAENGMMKPEPIVTLEDAKEALQCKHLAYDKAGDEHYNLISALHKSMRGSDANAAIYWLARMLEGGEQPLYIARRLVRFASEDVGLADPSALPQAVACYQACHFIGMPECNVILAQCVAYLALAPKSIAVYRAFGAAQRAVKDSIGQNEGVPLHLRNAPTKLMKDLEYGKGYIYTPDNPLAPQSFLPPSLQNYKFFEWPDNNIADG